MAVEEQLLYGPELPENFLDYYKIPAGPYDPMAEWRLREEAENERSFAQLKAGTALSNIRDPGASIRRYTPPQSGGIADFRVGNPYINFSNLDKDSLDEFGNPVNVRNTEVNVNARFGLDNLIESDPELAATISGMLGRYGVEISSKEGEQLYEDFKRRWELKVGLGTKDFGGSFGWSDNTDTESLKAELHKTFDETFLNAEVRAKFDRDIRDRDKGESETTAGLQVTIPFSTGHRKGGMVRNPYPYEPKTI